MSPYRRTLLHQLLACWKTTNWKAKNWKWKRSEESMENVNTLGRKPIAAYEDEEATASESTGEYPCQRKRCILPNDKNSRLLALACCRTVPKQPPIQAKLSVQLCELHVLPRHLALACCRSVPEHSSRPTNLGGFTMQSPCAAMQQWSGKHCN